MTQFASFFLFLIFTRVAREARAGVGLPLALVECSLAWGVLEEHVGWNPKMATLAVGRTTPVRVVWNVVIISSRVQAD